MAKKDFCDVSSYPNKLIRQLRRQIAITGYLVAGVMWDEQEEKHYQNFEKDSSSFHKQYRKLVHDGTSALNTWDEFNDRLKTHMDQYADCIDDTLNTICVYEFAMAEIEEQQIVSTRHRIEREKKIRDRIRDGMDTKDIEWRKISFNQYAPSFLNWLVNSWNDNKAEWAWKSEDWSSDISYVMRGYLLARNKQDGSGFDIFGTKTIEEAKALAEPHIPREGIDVFINAFDAAGYDRSTLPEPWQGEAQFTIDFPNLYAANPKFEVMEANDDHIILHIKNMDAAIACGYQTSWCTSDPPEDNAFDDYSDALVIICDKGGRRFQVHPRTDQFHNEADNSVNPSELFEAYPKLLPILFSLSSQAALGFIQEHIELTELGHETKYEEYKNNLTEIANTHLSEAIDSQNIEQLCQLFNAVSSIKIQDIRDDIWLSFDKKLIQRAIDIIPDAELGIGYFVETYW